MPIRRPARFFRVFALATLLLLSAPASINARSAYQPVTVVDESGVQTTFTTPPQRIVSLNPGHTETVFALGAGDRLVAVDTSSNYPIEAQQVQPRLTTYPTVSIETIVSLKPDLVLALVGATNIFADLSGDSGQVSAEAVVARDPDLIVLADAYSPYNPQTPALVATRPGWQQVAAVRHDAVYAVQEELFATPSPHLADGLEALAYLIHPDRFAASGGPQLAPRAGVDPYCAPGQTSVFSFGFQGLSEALGTQMGDPTECAHADVANGDTYQQTTTGLAIYRRTDNTPAFVSSSSHWSLTADGLVEMGTVR